jgi:Na+/H+ antiporter NhaD/arsenite permease-like protein
MTAFIIAAFIAGYLCIALESKTKVNKAAAALCMSVVCWSAYMLGADGPAEGVFSSHVAEACETMLFLMGAMTIVEVVDTNGGFHFVTHYLRTDNPKALLWKTVLLTFFLSALLDNMTTCIVMVMVLKKLVADRQTRLLYAGITILAANAGGAFSPIGDVTTIMLWIKGCVSTTGIITGLFIPSIVSAIIPAIIMPPMLKGTLQPAASTASSRYGEDGKPWMSHNARRVIFALGVGGLMLVPVFRSITGLPPFVGVMGVLAVLWIATEIIIRRNKHLLKVESEVRVSSIIKKTDMSTLLFFLGILLTVGALQETGTLNRFGIWLSDTFGNIYIVDSLIGIMSSIVDNVPLVASAMGMYDIAPDGAIGALQAYSQDGAFWELLAYCAGTGGSILIIGSAAGVVVMGLENISFGWYLKHFCLIALIGYFAGILVYWLQSILL